MKKFLFFIMLLSSVNVLLPMDYFKDYFGREEDKINWIPGTSLEKDEDEIEWMPVSSLGKLSEEEINESYNNLRIIQKAVYEINQKSVEALSALITIIKKTKINAEELNISGVLSNLIEHQEDLNKLTLEFDKILTTLESSRE